MRLAVVYLAVSLALLSQPVFSQEASPPPENPPQETDSQEAEPQEVPPEEDEASRIESMSESLIEIRNIVELLNRLKISGYIQGQYVQDDSSINEANGPSATRNRDQFSVRRGRLKLVYTAAPTARFTLAMDAASSGVTLKDAFVELIEPWTTWRNTLTAGQFNWPFGFEIMYSSSDREMPERSRVVRTLFPGERDRGVMLSGLGFAERFRYQVALVNGTGTSQPFDFNQEKDLVGRVGWTAGPLDLGLSGYFGEDLVATTGNPRGSRFDKERQGIDFQVITPVEGLGFRGEYITGKERGADVAGWYAYAIQNLGTRHQLIVRADEYDPNSDISRNAIFTLGGSYIFHWDANLKVMFAYEHPDTEGTDPEDDVTTLRMQYKF